MHFPRSPGLHLLVAAALLLRALIPAGFMPAASGRVPALVLCTAQGAKAIDQRGAGYQQHAQCPFAAALGMAALPVPALALPASVAAQAPRIDYSSTALRRAVSGFNARGPPLFA